MYCDNCGRRIEPDDKLNAAIGCVHCRGQKAKETFCLIDERDKYERHLIEMALERNMWNVTRAAFDLQILRTTLLYKIKRYGLSPDGSGNEEFHAKRHAFLNLDGPINW